MEWYESLIVFAASVWVINEFAGRLQRIEAALRRIERSQDATYGEILDLSSRPETKKEGDTR